MSINRCQTVAKCLKTCKIKQVNWKKIIVVICNNLGLGLQAHNACFVLFNVFSIFHRKEHYNIQKEFYLKKYKTEMVICTAIYNFGILFYVFFVCNFINIKSRWLTYKFYNCGILEWQVKNTYHFYYVYSLPLSY